jgi:hypothetical protein
VEQLTLNQKAEGSSPSRPTNKSVGCTPGDVASIKYSSIDVGEATAKRKPNALP